MSLFQQQILHWFTYFDIYQDSSTTVWLLSDEPSPLFNSSFNSSLDFGAENSTISLIDPFDGRKPWLLNYDWYQAFKSGLTYYNIYQTGIIFDSNVLSSLQNYFINPHTIDKNIKCATESFLRFLYLKEIELGGRNKFDLNTTFYFIESIVKNGKEKAKKKASNASLATLYLHTLDERVFLENGKIILDKQRVEQYARNHGLPSSSSLDEIAPLWTDNMINSFSEADIKMYENNINYTRSALLKMILISCSKKSTVREKIQEFYDFLEHKLGIILGLELIISVYFFSKNLKNDFIPHNLGMSFEKLKRKVRSTCWDIFYLRMPEILLFSHNEANMTLYYLCTQEQQLGSLGRLFPIQSAVVSSWLNLPTVRKFKLEKIKFEIGDEVFNYVSELQEKLLKNRLDERIRNQLAPIPQEELKILITDMEEQLSFLCKG